MHQSALLWSINERLGALCQKIKASEAGLDATQLGYGWIGDLVNLALDTADEESGVKKATPKDLDGLVNHTVGTRNA